MPIELAWRVRRCWLRTSLHRLHRAGRRRRARRASWWRSINGCRSAWAFHSQALQALSLHQKSTIATCMFHFAAFAASALKLAAAPIHHVGRRCGLPLRFIAAAGSRKPRRRHGRARTRDRRNGLRLRCFDCKPTYILCYATSVCDRGNFVQTRTPTRQAFSIYCLPSESFLKHYVLHICSCLCSSTTLFSI